MRDFPAALRRFAADACLVLPTTAAALLVHGYHPGAEDDGVYLAAIQHRLHPALFPHDAAFFTLQMQATVFDSAMASLVRLSHLPVGVTLFLAQFAAIALVLWGCLRVARLCFPREIRAQRGAVFAVAALLTMGVAGTAIMLVDQHLHPRTIATGLILAALADALPPATAARRGRAAALLLAAMLFHPIMGAFGISMVCALWLTETEAAAVVLERLETAGLAVEARAAVAVGLISGGRPLQWLFDPPTADWRAATATRSYLFLSEWRWYELLGLVAPFFILSWLQKRAEDQGSGTLAHLLRATRVFYVFQFAFALVMMHVPAMERLESLQPLRFLHLVYLVMVLVVAGMVTQFLYKRSRVAAYALLLLPAGALFLHQREAFPADRHLELPGRASKNPWTQAFAWVRQNTPEDAYFALPPRYLDSPGEGEHGFRALALRSALADESKDAGVVMQVPHMAAAWRLQTAAVHGWDTFTRADMLRLHTQTGAGWVLLDGPGTPGLPCPYHNSRITVCRIE